MYQIFSPGNQTRSFMYIRSDHKKISNLCDNLLSAVLFQNCSDLVTGLIALMNSDYSLPVNLGNPEEHTIKEFAEIVQKEIGN